MLTQNRKIAFRNFFLIIEFFNRFLFHFSKSYNYQIQMPPTEIEPENTKYKFDYTLQAPVEETPVENPERVMYTKVDRMIQDKPGELK